MHESHPQNPAWSATAKQAFVADFTRMQSHVPIKLVRVDCRAESCLAIIGWKNYTAAQISGSMLATFDYSIRCARHVAQPPPDDISLPYRSIIQFDCGGMIANDRR